MPTLTLDLTKTNDPFEKSKLAQEAFQELKNFKILNSKLVSAIADNSNNFFFSFHDIGRHGLSSGIVNASFLIITYLNNEH